MINISISERQLAEGIDNESETFNNGGGGGGDGSSGGGDGSSGHSEDDVGGGDGGVSIRSNFLKCLFCSIRCKTFFYFQRNFRIGIE